MGADACIGFNQFVRDEAALQQQRTAVVTIALGGQRDARLERSGTPDRMNPGDAAPEDGQVLGVFDVGRVTALARKQREPKTALVKQRGAALVLQRRNHGHLMREEFGGECVFLQNLRVAPAIRAVELADDRFAFFLPDLINPILVAVQRQQAAVAAPACSLDGVEQRIGREVRIGSRISHRRVRLKRAAFYRRSCCRSHQGWPARRS